MKIKITILSILIVYSISLFSQSIPDFLQGTWKVENEELYEHWDKLNDNSMRGFAYFENDGKMEVFEHLEISKKKNKVIYSAAVQGQNEGKIIVFKQTKSGETVIFENPKYDFPSKIEYTKLNENELKVSLFAKDKDPIEYKMIKLYHQSQSKDSTIKNPNYNASLAKKLGGDDYGMKGFILVILKTRTNTSTDRNFINEQFRGHMENINRLVDAGKMIVAGPLGENDKTYRGIFILNASMDEAKELMQTDPAIKADLLDVELYDWYGSAALPEYLDASDKIWKEKP